MPQIFQVLKCFKCSVFQVHQTKKANKWGCKLCGEKQSIKRHYGLGTAKECRLHVQKLNGIRGELDELSETSQLNKSSDEEPEIPLTKKKPVVNRCQKSKWSNFVEKASDNVSKEESDENMFLGNAEVVLQIPVKKRKTFKPPIVQCTSINTEVKTMSLDYEPVEPVFTQTETSESNFLTDNNSFFKSRKQKPQTKISKPIVPSFCKSKESIKNQPKISTSNTNYNIDSHEKNKTYVPPKVNKNSKWAEYADDSEENVNEDFESIIEENSTKNILVTDAENISQERISKQNNADNVTHSHKNMSQNSSKQYFLFGDDCEIDDELFEFI